MSANRTVNISITHPTKLKYIRHRSHKVLDQCCILHLLDLTNFHKKYNNYDLDDDESINSSESDKPLCLDKTEYINALNEYITDQYIDLWKMMKRGDLIEDISLLGRYDFNMFDGRYIVDSVKQNKKNEAINLIRNNLTIKLLDQQGDELAGTVVPTRDYLTITEFPINYFDNIIINNHHCDCHTPFLINEFWGNHKCKIRLDMVELGLKKIKINEIQQKTYSKIVFLYVTFEYDNANFMIIQSFENTNDIKKQKSAFLRLLHKETLFQPKNINNSKYIYKIAHENNICKSNIIYL